MGARTVHVWREPSRCKLALLYLQCSHLTAPLCQPPSITEELDELEARANARLEATMGGDEDMGEGPSVQMPEGTPVNQPMPAAAPQTQRPLQCACTTGREHYLDEEKRKYGMDIVLHEDKKYYPTAEEVFGKDTEVLVQDEDAQPIEVPIIAPVKTHKFEANFGEEWRARYSDEFLGALMGNPDLIRNVAVAGHLHHGKTTFMDMLVEQTHAISHEMTTDGKQARTQ